MICFIMNKSKQNLNKKAWKLEEFNELAAIQKEGIKKEDVGIKPLHC